MGDGSDEGVGVWICRGEGREGRGGWRWRSRYRAPTRRASKVGGEDEVKKVNLYKILIKYPPPGVGGL